MRYTIDCEFDGHNGPLISLALVPETNEKKAFYLQTWHKDPVDPWVRENVIPILDDVPLNVAWCVTGEPYVGYYIRSYLAGDTDLVFIADSPVDIAPLTNYLSTDHEGQWQSTNYKRLAFLVLNVDCWPNDLGPEAKQHNAYWDAFALWEKIYAEV